MVQFRTLLILFVISFAIISIAYAEAEEDEFAVKSLSDTGSVSPISVHRQRRNGYSGYGYVRGYSYGGYGYSGYGYGRGYGYGGYGYGRGYGYGGLGRGYWYLENNIIIYIYI